MAASCNSIYGRHREVFGYINDTGSGTSITVFSFFTSIARLEKGKLGRPSLRTYKVLSFIVITQGRGGLYLIASIKINYFILCNNVPILMQWSQKKLHITLRI